MYTHWCKCCALVVLLPHLNVLWELRGYTRGCTIPQVPEGILLMGTAAGREVLVEKTPFHLPPEGRSGLRVRAFTRGVQAVMLQIMSAGWQVRSSVSWLGLCDITPGLAGVAD